MALSRVIYWRLATVIPAVFPAVATPAWLIAEVMGAPLPQRIGEGMIVSFMGAFLFLPIYMLLVGLVLFVLRSRSWTQHAMAAVVAPALMTIVVAAIGPIASPGTGFVESAQLWGPFCLGLGYFYVGLAFAGMLVVEKTVGFSGAA